jgi:uncharacterized protein (TIGR02246 family)
MKAMLTTALLMTLALPTFAAPASSTKDEEAINQNARAFFAAWNKNDVKGLIAHWTDDATLINPFGRIAHGKAEIEKLFTDEQTTVFKGSTAKIGEVKVHMLKPGLAFTDLDMTIDGAHGADGAALTQLKYHVSTVVEKKGDEWLFLETRPYAFTLPPMAMAAKTD